jgi:hypothetical protein
MCDDHFVVNLLWVIDEAEFHVERVLGEEGAGSQRHLDVGRMSQRASNGQQLTITVIFEHDVTRQVNHLQVESVNKSLTSTKKAYQCVKQLPYTKHF